MWLCHENMNEAFHYIWTFRNQFYLNNNKDCDFSTKKTLYILASFSIQVIIRKLWDKRRPQVSKLIFSLHSIAKIIISST